MTVLALRFVIIQIHIHIHIHNTPTGTCPTQPHSQTHTRTRTHLPTHSLTHLQTLATHRCKSTHSQPQNHTNTQKTHLHERTYEPTHPHTYRHLPHSDANPHTHNLKITHQHTTTHTYSIRRSRIHHVLLYTHSGGVSSVRYACSIFWVSTPAPHLSSTGCWISLSKTRCSFSKPSSLLHLLLKITQK